MWFFSLWVRFVTIMISEKKARIMTNNIVADINHILDVITIINQATSEEEIRKCIPDLLEYCNDYNIHWLGDELGWLLVKDKFTSGRHANVNAYKFYLELSQLSEKFWEEREWKLWFYEYGNTCTVFDNDISKMAIDIKCLGNTSFIIEVFMRSKESDIENDLSEFATRHGLIYNGSR